MLNYNFKRDILKKILSNKIRIAVIGLGYVGLPLSLLLSKRDNVVGIDIDKKKINFLNSNKSYLERINKSKIVKFNKKIFFVLIFRELKRLIL